MVRPSGETYKRCAIVSCDARGKRAMASPSVQSQRAISLPAVTTTLDDLDNRHTGPTPLTAAPDSADSAAAAAGPPLSPPLFLFNGFITEDRPPLAESSNLLLLLLLLLLASSAPGKTYGASGWARIINLRWQRPSDVGSVKNLLLLSSLLPLLLSLTPSSISHISKVPYVNVSAMRPPCSSTSTQDTGLALAYKTMLHWRVCALFYIIIDTKQNEIALNIIYNPNTNTSL